MNFECPRCGSHRIEEILIDVVQATEVFVLNDMVDTVEFH